MALRFELVTPEKLYRSDDVYMVVVPGSEGDFGVLEGHSPMMSTLRNDAALEIYATQAAREGVCESIRPRAEPHGGKARLERASPTRWLFETLQSTCFDWSGNRLAMDRKAHERRLIPKGSSQGHRGEDLGEAKRQGRREAHFGLIPGWHPRERAMRTSSRSTRDGRVERR